MSWAEWLGGWSCKRRNWLEIRRAHGVITIDGWVQWGKTLVVGVDVGLEMKVLSYRSDYFLKQITKLLLLSV